MNKPDEQKKDAATIASLELASLNKQVDRAREELVRLQRAVAEAESRLRSALATHQLCEANERLVIAALRAQTDAETSAQALREVSRSIEIDALTDLPNRTVLLERLTAASVNAKSHGFQLAVLFVDLNGFKQINDTLGHAVGDQVLKRAAQGLASSVRAADTVSRYGGDEFLILLNDISRADAAMVASRVVEVLAFPVRIGEAELRLTASVGISLFPDDSEDPDTLVDRADAAMYSAKRLGQGGGGYAFYVEEPAGTRRSSIVDLTFPRVADSDLAATQPARHADLKEANEQLVLAAIGAQELRAAAEKAQLRQTEFLAVIAHELRNPLSPILAAAQSLGQGGASQTLVPRARAIIERQVAHMSRLLNDLLDMSRVTTGKFTLERQNVEMSNLVSEAIDICQHSVDTRSQRLTVRKPSCALTVHGDSARLTQILVNLVDNASKYTPDHGEIDLEIEVVGDTIVLTLSDTGIGITADALPDVFEPFIQDTQAIAFNDAGLGIGLTVVRELVEAHSGSVVARSAGSGLGSQFVVTLPLAR